jgi:hypothetical protein
MKEGSLCSFSSWEPSKKEGCYYRQALILNVPEVMILMKILLLLLLLLEVMESIALEELMMNSHRLEV